MVETRDHFVKRLSSLGHKHEQMTYGYTTKVGKDGLIIVKPKRKARNSSGLKFTLLALGLFFGLKIFMLASLGPASYTDRLTGLQEGTIVEKVGAFVMGMDPITLAAADYASPFIRSVVN